jgi:hypothetical protein
LTTAISASSTCEESRFVVSSCYDTYTKLTC